MSLQELFSQLNRQGIHLEVVENNLEIKAPRGKLTPALVKRLREKKQELITFLQSHFQHREKYSAVEIVEKKEYYLLSSAQKRVYIIQRMDLAVIAYNMPVLLELAGEFDKDKFTGAFRRLIARHESLRTSFHILDDEPMQKIHHETEFEIEYDQSLVNGQWSLVNCQGRGEVRSPIKVEKIIRNFIRTFDLSKAPLLRVGLIKIGKHRHILMVDTHHIVADGVSRGVFIKDFISLYQGEELPRLPIQYKDFTRWQNREKDKDVMKRQEEYWMKEFSDEIPVLNLPVDFVRPPVKCFEGSTVDFELNPGETKELKKLAREEDDTLFMGLLAIYNIFLSKISGQEDIIIGTPISGRGHSYLQRIIGMFVNTLALRNAPNGRKSFKEFLKQLSGRTLEAFENRDYQFEDLVEQVAVQRDANRNPVFDTMFTLENMEISGIKIPGLKLKPYDYQNGNAKFDLMLTAVEAGENLQFTFEYCTKLFKEETVRRFTGFFHKIISTVLGNCDIRISGIEIINEEEKNRVLYEFNDTVAEYPRDKAIYQLFEEQVVRTPNHVALLGKEEGRKGRRVEGKKGNVLLTYKELNGKSNQLANLLKGKGVGPDTIAGIMVERSIEMVIGILGILKFGGAYLPIEPDYPKERIQYILSDSNAKVLLATPGAKVKAEVKEESIEQIDISDLLSFSTLSLTLTSTCQVSPTNLAYIIYTSGSTGKPKGVIVEHRAVMNLLMTLQEKYPLGPWDRYLLKTSYVFDVSVTELFGWFWQGGRLVVLEKGGGKDPQMIVETIAREKVTHINFVPSMFNVFTGALEPGIIGRLSGLKYIFLAGEALLSGTVTRFRQLNTMVALENIYGPTEATVYASWYSLSGWTGEGSIPIGKPLRNINLYIFNKWGYLQPVGVPGELCISSAGLARGYLNQPALTAEKFRRAVNSHWSSVISSSKKLSKAANDQCLMTNDKSYKAHNDQCPMTNDRFYKTGDLARWLPDGNIEFLGRMDFQVKIRGFRIEMGEIENRLLKHEEIKEVVVVTKTDEQGDKYLCAYIAADKQIEILKLRHYLGKDLPGYMIPSYFVQLDKIPLTPSGKINRKLLPVADIQKERDFVAPRDEVEKKLVEIWSEVLGIEKEKISINSNFFHLGGHSLKATVLISRVHKEFNVNIPLNEIFNTPRIRGLAAYIKEAGKSKYIPIEAMEKKDYYPLSSAQRRLYILQQIDEEQGIGYNIPSVWQLEGNLDAGKFAAVFQQLIQCHESLRTSFKVVNDEPVQRIDDETVISHWSLVIGKADGKEIDDTIKSFVKPFDLSQAPLLRVELAVLEKEKHLLQVDMHHIISDGTSANVLIKDFMALYSGKDLSEPRIQYKDFSEWQNSKEQAASIKQQEIFWIKEFESEIPILELPTDYARPTVQSFEGSAVTFEIGEVATRALKRYAFEKGVTLFMVLLAIIDVLLYRLSNQEDIVIGSPIAGRRHPDLVPVIGMFVNTLPLRTIIACEKSFSAFLEEVKRKTLKAYENQEYPFEKLVEVLDVNRDDSRNPLFDVLFVLQNMEYVTVQKIPGLIITPYPYEHRTSKFDLHFNGVEIGEKLSFALEYSTRLFLKQTVLRIVEYFKRVVAAVIENPRIMPEEIEIIGDKEREEILRLSTGIKELIEDDVTIHYLLEQKADQLKNGTALVFRGQELTYKELNRKSNRVAKRLREMGVGPDTVVGLMVERSFEMVIGILGILKAGGAYLPIDTDYPDSRKKYMLQDSKVSLVLTNFDTESISDCISNNTEVISLGDEDVYSLEEENPGHNTNGFNLVYIIYTSGSTGEPKGIMMEHRSMVNLINYQINRTNIPLVRVLQFTTISFDVSFQEIFSTLLAGGTLYLVDKETRNDIPRLFEFIKENEVETLFLPASFLKFVMNEKEYIDRMHAGVQHIVTAGEQVIVGNRFKNFLKENRVWLHNHYGPAETHVVTTLTLDPNGEIPELPNIGKPISNTGIYILCKGKRLQPIGVPGELFIGNIQVSRGYSNREKLTSERFLKNPFVSGERMYETGDLARWLMDGNIEFLGRIDFQVKIRGFRVELGEVESRLLTHNEITEAVVVLKEDTPGTQRYLCGYFVSNRNLSISGLREYLSKTLPDYMIPSYFVQVDKIPITPNGKIDRKTLPAPKIKAGEDYVAPRDEVEKKLVEIWSEVLGTEKEKISITSNFFHLGGHSLKATILISKLHQSLNIKLPLTELFKSPTIKKISHYIKHMKGAARNKYTSLDKIEEREYYELSSAQKRLFILDQTEGAINTAYNLPGAMLIEGELNIQHVEDSFNTLITRHDSFRTSFDIKGGKPVQIIHDTVVFKIKYSTLEDGHPGKKALDPRMANELNLIVKDFIKPFELGKAPLLRAALICLGSKKHLLLFDMHHIISDGFSTRILVKEFLHFSERKALPQLKFQYKDFTGWQNKLLNSGEMKKQEDYWLNRFRGDIPVLNMPTDYPRQPVKNFEGNTIKLEIDRELTGKISEVMEETGTTLYMILLAIFNILLSKYTGQEDIIVGVPAAARSHPDLENIIGMFVNTLAMRNYPGKERSFDDFLQEVKEHALKAFENQDYPFEELVNKLGISKDYSRNPLFDVLFVSEKLEIPGLELKGLTFTPFEIENKISHMDLVLYIVEENDTIVLRLEYADDLFKRSGMEGMLKHYAEILEQAVKDRSVQLEEIDISQDLLVAQANIVKENLEDFGF